jgi:hypothetical protein
VRAVLDPDGGRIILPVINSIAIFTRCSCGSVRPEFKPAPRQHDIYTGDLLGGQALDGRFVRLRTMQGIIRASHDMQDPFELRLGKPAVHPEGKNRTLAGNIYHAGQHCGSGCQRRGSNAQHGNQQRQDSQCQRAMCLHVVLLVVSMLPPILPQFYGISVYTL